MVPEWWDWNISGRARLASLASAWLLVAFAWAPLALILPIAVVRFGASFTQTFWNWRLDRVHPMGPRNLLDWGMFAAALGASILVAALAEAGIELARPATLALVLAPISIIQLKATFRSFSVHNAIVADRRVVTLRLRTEQPAQRAA